MKGILGRYDILLTVLVFLLAIPAERMELFSALEDQTVSFRHIARPGGELDDAILFVNTDEAFFEAYGSFPLRRTDIGRIAKNLHDLGAEVVAIDLLFDFPSSYGEDDPTAALLDEAGKVLVVSQGVVEDGEVVDLNYPVEPIRAVARSGYTNIQSASTIIQSMNRIRVFEEALAFEDGWPFAVQAVSLFLDAEPDLGEGVLYLGDELEVPLDQHNDVFIDFPRFLPGTRTYSESHGLSALEFLDLSALDEDELEELREWVEGRIVLIGDTSEVSHDYFNTPIGTVYGVEIIGATVSTLLAGGPLQPAGAILEVLVLLVLAVVLVGTAFLTNPIPRIAAAAAALLVWAVLCFWLYGSLGMVLSMSYAMVAGFLAFLIINLRFYLQERGQKTLIRDAFGHYLSPKVVNILVKDPSKLSLGGELREMTAYFSDIAGFSTISEQLSPEELVALLNAYLTDMCDIISDYDGTVDKFEGDAIIAFWGAPLQLPDHAKLACFATIDMQKHMVDYRQKLAAEGRPLLNVRMGLNTGPMLVGNLGSAQRMDYTIMGDSVNLAARLEGANKFYGTDTMISQFTHAKVADVVEVRELDTIRVVGKREPITVYQLLERKGHMEPEMAEMVRQYDAALALYKGRDFGAALEAFQGLQAQHPDDGPADTYVGRCKSFLETPPADDWDGVYTLTSKG